MASDAMKTSYMLLLLIAAGVLSACTSLPTVKRTDFSPQVACPVTSITTGENFASRGSLQITTYNLRGIKDPAGLRSDFSALAGTHVFALQEVTSPRDSCHLPEALLAILPPGTWHIFNYPLNAVRGGFESQTIASRYPIATTSIIPLAHHGAKNRVALVAEIKAPSGSVIVVNTDHEAGFWKGVGYNQRRHQLESLRAGIEIIDPAKPIVLTGDFNTYGNLLQRPFLGPRAEISATRAFIERMGFQAASNVGPTFRSLFVSLTLDHFFVRKLPNPNWSKLKHRIGSDHYPITVLFDPPADGASTASSPESP